ncbi:MAG TPA: type II secretion system protein [Tepidisphaeraceae bacterium]|nr:type II secretion system protein [Tepidisphaeraceae bacterium]
MNKKLNTTAQGGFTLIELIVVIVILGILAATALPKFSSLGGDARVATLNAARGSIASVVAMAHGKALVSGNSATPVTFENVQVALVNGYPSAAATTANAAGIETGPDFTVLTGANATAGTAGPVRTATQFAIVPTAVAGTANAANCYVLYTEATASAATPPVITPPTVVTTATADNCQ